MREETLLQLSFDTLTEKLDNTQEYEDWLLVQEYIDRLRGENQQLKEQLKQRDEVIDEAASFVSSNTFYETTTWDSNYDYDVNRFNEESNATRRKLLEILQKYKGDNNE